MLTCTIITCKYAYAIILFLLYMLHCLNFLYYARHKCLLCSCKCIDKKKQKNNQQSTIMMCRYTSIIYYYTSIINQMQVLVRGLWTIVTYIVLGYCEVQTCMTSVSGHTHTVYTISERKAESLNLFMLSNYVHVYFCMCPCMYMFRHMSTTYISTCCSFNPVPIMACKILVEVQANYKLCANKTAVPYTQ